MPPDSPVYSKSVVRRTLVRQTLVSGWAPGRASVAQGRKLPAQARNILGHFQHRLVLLRDVALEVRDLLFEMSSVVVQRWEYGDG